MSSVGRGRGGETETDYCTDYYGLYGYEWVGNIEIVPTTSFFLPSPFSVVNLLLSSLAYLEGRQGVCVYDLTVFVFPPTHHSVRQSALYIPPSPRRLKPYKCL